MPSAVNETVAIANLDLDPTNFRLPEEVEGDSQLSLLRYFYATYNLEELAWSIADEGFWEEEPLLTVRATEDGPRRVVVEGNRRLATLILLTDGEKRSELEVQALWTELAELASDHDLTSVPTRLYSSRDELLHYLGFRHVSGLLKWDADAKARFIYELVRDRGMTFQDAARAIGSRRDAVGRNYIAWCILEQGRNEGVDIRPASDHFGVFYRSLQSPGIRSFLELGDLWLHPDETVTAPLGESGAERLTEFIGFALGPDRVIPESRRLDDLGTVLQDKGALATLRSERDLELALEEISPSWDMLFAMIRRSYRSARVALAEAPAFRGDERLLTEIERLHSLVEQLRAALQPTHRDGPTDSDAP